MPVDVNKGEKGVPVITQSFASSQVCPGETWKVYLKASDPGGDMKTLYCVIDQPGRGMYPVGHTRIPEDQQRELSGYLYLNTAGVAGPDFASIVLRVEIQDGAGNFSEPVSFPLDFNARALQEPPPPDAFEEKDLGPIMIQLRTVGDDDRPNLFHRFRR